MNRDKYLQNIFERGMQYGPIIKQYLIEEYKVLNFSSTFKNMIFENISRNQDFEILILEMQNIIPALENRIDELLNDKDFNPFKEELRKRYPVQYSSQPFEYKGTIYYLYSKGFSIDSLISRTINFKNLVEEHINANMPLKYVYKE